MTLLAYSFPISIYRFHLFRFTGIMNLWKKGSLLQVIGGLIPRTFTIIIVYVINIIIVIFILFIICNIIHVANIIIIIFFIIFDSVVYLHYIYRCRCAVVTMMSIIIIIVNIVTIIRCNIILTNPYFIDPKRTYSTTLQFMLFLVFKYIIICLFLQHKYLLFGIRYCKKCAMVYCKKYHVR